MDKQCISCTYYPKDCGYWFAPWRAINKTASFVSPYTLHGCNDYKPMPFIKPENCPPGLAELVEEQL